VFSLMDDLALCLEAAKYDGSCHFAGRVLEFGAKSCKPHAARMRRFSFQCRAWPSFSRGKGFKEDATSAPNTKISLRTQDEETAKFITRAPAEHTVMKRTERCTPENCSDGSRSGALGGLQPVGIVDQRRGLAWQQRACHSPGRRRVPLSRVR
jgi:hypothetical protein